jgi:hypothetical protein
MSLHRVWQNLVRRLKRPEPATRRRPGKRTRLLVEVLEDRVVPTNFFVSTLGVDDTAHGSAAAPFRNIQFAINQANNGDRIHVATGTYGYNAAVDSLSGFLHINPAVIEIADKQLSLFGGFDNTFTQRDSNAFPTVIDGGGQFQGAYFLAGGVDTSVAMDGFTMQNGVSRPQSQLGGLEAVYAFGGGMFINDAARPTTAGPYTLSNMIFKNNQAIAANSDVGGNAAGGALGLRFVNNITLQNVAFDSNTSQGGAGGTSGGGGLGGAIHADQSTVTGFGVTFTNNRALAGAATGDGKTATGVTADALGGAVAVQVNASVNFQGVIATGNVAIGGNAATNAGIGFGGAFYAEDATISLTDGNLRGNIARGGTATNGGQGAGGAVESLNSTVVLNRVQVVVNSAQAGNGSASTSAGGGGLYFTRIGKTDSTFIALTNTLVADNSVVFTGPVPATVGGGGGGIWFQGVNANLTQCTIANNSLTAPLAAGVAMILIDSDVPKTTVGLSYSIVANHANGGSGSAAVSVGQGVSSGGNNAITYNTVMYSGNAHDDNSAGGAAGTFNGLASVIHARNVAFVSPGAPAEDYHLQAVSPAINMAVGSATTLDLDQNVRTPPPDLGAYEFTPPPLARTSVGVFDPSTATWYLKNRNSKGAPDYPPFAFGGPNWFPVVGDWDGNGTWTVGVVDPTTETWYLRNSNSAGGPSYAAFQFGAPGWIPVVGDWNHTGHTGIGVFDPSTGIWYLRNEVGPGAPDAGSFAYGAPGWIPLAGDYDGNGTFTVGVVDPTTETWYLRNENSSGAPDAGQFAYGAPGWKPVVGDWNNDKKFTPGVFAPNEQWYLRNENSSGGPDAGSFLYGAGTWTPLAGDYDGLAGELAAGGEGPGAAPISSGDLGGIVAAALTKLANEGTDPALLGRLAAAQVQLTHFGNGTLGLASAATNRIYIDDDGAGYGWFVDPTPLQDEEFSGGVALSGGPAAGRMDLLTVVLHEMGHLMGGDDVDGGDGLMAGTLPVGVRRS